MPRAATSQTGTPPGRTRSSTGDETGQIRSRIRVGLNRRGATLTRRSLPGLHRRIGDTGAACASRRPSSAGRASTKYLYFRTLPPTTPHPVPLPPLATPIPRTSSKNSGLDTRVRRHCCHPDSRLSPGGSLTQPGRYAPVASKNFVPRSKVAHFHPLHFPFPPLPQVALRPPYPAAGPPQERHPTPTTHSSP